MAVDRETLVRCQTVWTDKGLLPVTLITDLTSAPLLHDCHKIQGHTGKHRCACNKEIDP